MKNVVFLAHWSFAFVEEQFYAMFKQLRDANESSFNLIYFCEWNNGFAVDCLINHLFCGTTHVRHFTNYPAVTTNNTTHQLSNCTKEDTIFVLYFTPRHLQFFLQSTAQRFPKRYIWWQVEQSSNKSFFSDEKYCQVIRNALAIIEFSRSNGLDQFSNPRFQIPFSRENLFYNDDDASPLTRMRLENICNHQKKRLLQDNPAFLHQNVIQFRQQSVLLLGTCEPRRRMHFKQMCLNRNINIVHPFQYYYYFGLERQKFICDFVRSCANHLAIGVNIHQYENSVLEQAKIYLLLANGCDVVVSEKSRSLYENTHIKSVCGDRIILVDSFDDAVGTIENLIHKEKMTKNNLLTNPKCYKALFARISQEIAAHVS